MKPNIQCPNHGDKFLEKSNTKEWIYLKCTKCSYLVRIKNEEESQNDF